MNESGKSKSYKFIYSVVKNPSSLRHEFIKLDFRFSYFEISDKGNNIRNAMYLQKSS